MRLSESLRLTRTWHRDIYFLTKIELDSIIREVIWMENKLSKPRYSAREIAAHKASARDMLDMFAGCGRYAGDAGAYTRGNPHLRQTIEQQFGQPDLTKLRKWAES